MRRVTEPTQQTTGTPVEWIQELCSILSEYEDDYEYDRVSAQEKQDRIDELLNNLIEHEGEFDKITVTISWSTYNANILQLVLWKAPQKFTMLKTFLDKHKLLREEKLWLHASTSCKPALPLAINIASPETIFEIFNCIENLPKALQKKLYAQLISENLIGRLFQRCGPVEDDHKNPTTFAKILLEILKGLARFYPTNANSLIKKLLANFSEETLFSLLSTTFLYKTKNTSIISFLAIYHPKCIPTLLDKMSQDAFKTHLAKFSPRCDSLTPLDHLEKKHRPTISPEEIAKTRNYLLQIIGITPSLEQLSKQLESDAPDLTLVNQLLERCEYYAEYCKGKSQQHEVKLLQQETITEFVSDPTIKTILGVTPHQKKHTTFANQLLNILRKLALSYPDKVDAFVEKILVKLTEEQLFSLLDAKHPYEGSSHLIEKGKEFPIMNFLAIHHPRCIPTLLEHIKLNILGKKNLVTYSPFGLLKPWDYLLLTHGAAFPEAQLSLLLSSHPHELSCSAASVDSLEPQKLLGLTQGATDIDIKPIIIAGDKFLRSQDKENWSMLSIAAWHDPALFRDLLLQRMETTDHEGNAIIKQDQHGFTVLHYVAANGDAALMEELLKKFGRRAKIATDIASKDGWIVVNESSTASDGVSRVASGIRLKLLPPPQPETTSSEKRRSSASAFFEVASSPEKQAQGPRDLDTSASGDPVNRFVR